MTEPSVSRPILVDPNLYNDRINRVDNFATAALYSGFAIFASFIVGAALVKTGHPSFIPLLVAVAVAGLIGVAFFWRKAHKVHRSLTDDVTATSDAVHTAILKKYNLDLVDPVAFDYVLSEDADMAADYPSRLLKISRAPQRAIDTVKNCYVEVVLTLSEDNRDVTASVLTPVATN